MRSFVNRAFVIGLLVLPSCSLALDWDKNGLPCDRVQACLDGYSCLGTECVEDGSKSLGDSCSDDAQCETSYRCDFNNFVCAKPCTTFYRDDSDCTGSTYCAPHPITDPATGDVARRGACAASQCTIDKDCKNAGDVCVKIRSNASACLPGCEVTWSNNTYSNNCGSTPSAPQYCQPLGVSKRLACLPTSEQGEGEDNLCDPIATPCREETDIAPITGLACIETLCSRHCNINASVSQCTGARVCVPQVGDDATYGICKALAPLN